MLQGGEGGEGKEVLAQQTGGPVRVATLLKTPEEGAVYTVSSGTSSVSCACVSVTVYVGSASSSARVGRREMCNSVED